MTKVQGRAEVGEAGLIETWHLGGLGLNWVEAIFTLSYRVL